MIGGYVYRGSHAPELSGAYLFADYCSGVVRALRRNGSGQWSQSTLLPLGAAPSSFGEGSGGELYIAAGNQIFELVSTAPNVPLLGGSAGCLALGLGALALAAKRRAR